MDAAPTQALMMERMVMFFQLKMAPRAVEECFTDIHTATEHLVIQRLDQVNQSLQTEFPATDRQALEFAEIL